MRVAAAQFAPVEDWRTNLARCRELVDRAAAEGVELLVFPEASIARLPDGARAVTAAQPLDGPFVAGLLAHAAPHPMTVVVGTLVPSDDGRAFNTLVAARGGEVVATYRKLHLYDAYGIRESDSIAPGQQPAVTFTVGGLTVGLMTCYDVRFPELARLLAERGAQLLALPAAWFDGPLKRVHWETLCRARAIENTCYLVGAGAAGPHRVADSLVIDPAGAFVSRLDDGRGLAVATADSDEVARARALSPLMKQRRFTINPVPVPADRAGSATSTPNGEH
ncbi:carbon-nitrogen hydrolase family protein [Streptomyces paludis]|uniref:Carbon-nitrogen hydrolase family protein n=1 Tax=Streptomyces paludis TaxID=2282738 RepID=A0A345HZX3_9ACTN|nr:carbon-nitrogen hydrolase family protein [Streptomyces paludis]